MSATELLEKVKALPPDERRRFLKGVYQLQKVPSSQARVGRKKPVRWPDAAARRRRIFGDKVVPNLVLLAREKDRY